MDIQEHHNRFTKIIELYGLSEESKAQEIADFLTKSHDKAISAKEFADLFAMKEEDAKIFLSFLEKGIRFKEKSLDPLSND